jgi:uncharacterized protein (TIGR01777 family)
VILAAEGGALPRMALPFRFGLGGPMGSGKQYLPWIHIEDVLRIIFYMIEQDDLEGPVNVVAPDPPTQREFAEAMGKALGRSSRVPTPAWLLKLVLGEMSDMVLSSYRAVPKALRARSFRFEHRELGAALRDLLA